MRAPRNGGGTEVHNWRREAEPWKNEVEAWRFTTGQWLEGKFPLAIPIYQGTVPLDFTLGAQDIPVVSQRVFKELKSLCGDSVQWIPASIPGINDSFFIANVLRILDALDMKQSEITRWKKEDDWPEKVGQIAGVARLVIKTAEVGHNGIFRLKNWNSPLFVVETFKKYLDDLHVTGIEFEEVATA